MTRFSGVMAATALHHAAMNGSHTAGIFSDMTLDGPEIGTLTVVMDRAKNLPNKRSMGKQDPYVAARLGKEAKKTRTDKRGGQTPRWDEELRFTVHDSPDYHRLKVSLFNDDRKTELIGETWINLESVLLPGGGPSDDWHGLSCKGKYAGEIYCKFTFHDNRVKPEKSAVEKTRQSARPSSQGPVRGPRETKPVKRRPLPSNPTAPPPLTINTPDHRALRGIVSGPRTLGTPRHQQASVQSSQHFEQAPSDAHHRRLQTDTSPIHDMSISDQNTTQSRATLKSTYSTPQNSRLSNSSVPLTREESFDMSYTAPKPYEIQALNSVQHSRDSTSRPMSQDNFYCSQGHVQRMPAEPIHSYSAPSVPTQHCHEHPTRQEFFDHHDDACSQNTYQDPAYQVAPLRTSRSRESTHEKTVPVISNPYLNHYGIEASPDHDLGSARRRSAMQPMVEDENDLPPPPPLHRRGAGTLPAPQNDPHSYSTETSEFIQYQEGPAQIEYQPSRHQYSLDDYEHHSSSGRRMTYPHAAEQPSHEIVAVTHAQQDISALPPSLIAGHSPVRQEREPMAFQASPAYENQPRLRHYSEPAEYRAINQYETPVASQALVHRSSFRPAEYDYPHDPPEQPRRTSPVYDAVPIVKPRAKSPTSTQSPHHSPNPSSERNSRGPSRIMPSRKSVSPRPPPSSDEHSERRLSSVAFDPDSFDVYNPRASRSPVPGASDDERPGSSLDYNEKGQIVTFNGRVVDASDHLPVESWAPEPTPKGTVKEKSVRQRVQLHGSRDLESAREREERYHQERVERERIRQAAAEALDAPSNALVTTRHDFSVQDSSQGYSGAMVLANPARRSRVQNSMLQQSDSAPQYNSPNSRVLRERPNMNNHSSSPSHDRSGRISNYGGRGPPIPAKVPLDTAAEDGYPADQEDVALSLELQSIDIGPGSGGRRKTRRNYGF